MFDTTIPLESLDLLYLNVSVSLLALNTRPMRKKGGRLCQKANVAS